MSYESNVYYNPENHGLAIVGEVEWSDGSYQFDLSVVWRRDVDGALFMAEDSGCSCPSPFDDYDVTSLAGPLSAGDVMSLLTSRLDEARQDDDNDYYYGGDLNTIADSIVRLGQRLVG